MCKFHEDVAIDIARRADGTIDPVAFAISSVALGTNFDIGHFIPEMPDLSGYSTYELASAKGQKNFRSSGIVYDPHAFTAFQSETLPILKERMQDIKEHHVLDTLTLKKIRTSSKAMHFIHKSPDELYQPFTDLTPQVFKNQKQADIYQSLRLAAADYWDDKNIQNILGQRFEQSVAVNFTEAPRRVNRTMLAAYEAIPEKLKKIGSSTGGACATLGVQGAVHIGCIKNAAFIVGGTTASGMMSSTQMLLWSGGASILGPLLTEGLHLLRGTVPKPLTRMITYGAALAGFTGMMAWHSLHHQDHQHPLHDREVISCPPPKVIEKTNKNIYELTP